MMILIAVNWHFHWQSYWHVHWHVYWHLILLFFWHSVWCIYSIFIGACIGIFWHVHWHCHGHLWWHYYWHVHSHLTDMFIGVRIGMFTYMYCMKMQQTQTSKTHCVFHQNIKAAKEVQLWIRILVWKCLNMWRNKNSILFIKIVKNVQLVMRILVWKYNKQTQKSCF